MVAFAPPAPQYDPRTQGASGMTPESANKDNLSSNANIGLGIGIGMSVLIVLGFIGLLLWLQYSRRQERRQEVRTKEVIPFDLPQYRASPGSGETIVMPSTTVTQNGGNCDGSLDGKEGPHGRDGCPYPRQSYRVPFELKPQTSFACIEMTVLSSPVSTGDRKSASLQGHPAYAGSESGLQKSLPESLRVADKLGGIV